MLGAFRSHIRVAPNSLSKPNQRCLHYVCPIRAERFKALSIQIFVWLTEFCGVAPNSLPNQTQILLLNAGFSIYLSPSANYYNIFVWTHFPLKCSSWGSRYGNNGPNRGGRSQDSGNMVGWKVRYQHPMQPILWKKTSSWTRKARTWASFKKIVFGDV